MVAESNFNLTDEPGLGYGQLFAILVRRSVWILGTLGGALVAATLITFLEKPTYESSMQLLIEPNYEQQSAPPGLESAAVGGYDKNDFATQLSLMRSQHFVQEVVDLLHSQYPDLDTRGVQKALTVSQVVEDGAETKIVQITYVDNDPAKTQQVLETLQTVYQRYNLNQQKLRLTRGVAFINEQLQSARQGLTQSQGALEQFRKRQNLINPEQQATAVSEALNKVRQEQQEVRATYQEAQARYVTLQQQLSLSPQGALIASRLSQSSRFQELLNQLQQTELALAERRAVFTDFDPSIQTLGIRRENQLALLQQEVSRVLGKQLNLSGEALLRTGQLSSVDQTLVSQLAETQVQLRSLQARSQSLTKTEQGLRAELNRFPGLIAEHDRLQPEVAIEQAVLQQLLQERQRVSADLSRGGFIWQVVESPRLGGQISPNPKQNLLLGIIAGIFLGGAVAFVREAMDQAVHTSDELKTQTPLPLLGILPEMPKRDISRLANYLPFPQSHSSEVTIVQVVQWSPFREALDLTYKNIQLLSSTVHPKSLVVTSALLGEGKSTLILGLALSAARLHQRVLVIDADLRRPALHTALGLPNHQGLSTLLAGDRAELNPVQVTLLGSDLDVLTSGPEPVDPVKLLNSQRLKELITSFEAVYDLILLDTPPILGIVDAIQIASFCDGVVMVGRLDRVTQTDFIRAIAMLNQLNILGIVANGSKSDSGSYVNDVARNGRAQPQSYSSIGERT